jgi:hypothetical protein
VRNLAPREARKMNDRTELTGYDVEAGRFITNGLGVKIC